MHASRGIKIFKELAVAALLKEYKQFHDKSVFGRIAYEPLTVEEKKKGPRAINLMKEKRRGKIKGRACADGSVQRVYVPRDEASSPTLSLESLLALLITFGY